MSSFAFHLFVATIVVLVLAYWAWQHWRAQRGTTAIELPMNITSESAACCQEGDFKFYSDGLFEDLSCNRAHVDGAAINYRTETGFGIHRRRGIGQLLHIERPDGVTHTYQYQGYTWYKLLAREETVGIVEEAIRQLRHSGLAALITIPERFAETVFAIPGFIIVVVMQLSAILLGLWLLFSLFSHGLTSTPTESPKPIFSPVEKTPQPVLLKTEVANHVSCLAFLSDHELAAAGGPYLTLWNTKTRCRIKTDGVPGKPYAIISSIDASPASGQVAAVVDAKVLLWDRRQGWISQPKRKNAWKGSATQAWGPPTPFSGPALRAPSEKVGMVQYSQDGQMLAAVGDDSTFGFIRLSDSQSQAPIQSLQVSPYVSSVDLSLDSRYLAVATGAGWVSIHDLSTHDSRKIAQLEPPCLTQSERSRPGNVVAFAPFENTLATATLDKINFWDIDGGVHVGSVGVAGRAEWLSFSPDGKLLFALCGFNAELKLVDVSSKSVLATAVPAIECSLGALSPDGETIAVGGRNDRIQLLSVSEILADATAHLKGL